MDKVKIKMRRAFEGAIEDAADNLHNARRDWFDENFYDDGSGLRPVDYLLNNLIAIVNDDDTTLRARLEELVVELEWTIIDDKKILNYRKLIKQLREILEAR